MLYDHIRSACANQKAEFRRRLADAKQLYLAKYRTDGLLQELIFRVSPKALALIWIQYRLAFEDWLKQPLGNPFAGCKRAFTAQYGLPCKHFIRNLLRGAEDGDDQVGGESTGRGAKALILHDVDRHWWLYPDGGDGFTEEQRCDHGTNLHPLVVTITKLTWSQIQLSTTLFPWPVSAVRRPCQINYRPTKSSPT
jgi:hypothetical protein